ncbi:MAG: glucan biosynthesis protein, partial [Hyphomicrobiales bacterium]
MKRREFLLTGTSAVSAAFLSSAFGSFFAGPASAAESDEGFSHELVQKQAAALATKPFKASVAPIDEHWAGITYDQYRDIRVPETARIWGGPGMPFQVDLLPAGFLFKEGVRVNLVEDGKASEIVPTLDRFTFGPNITVPEGIALPFSGFRIRTPINTPDVMDEAIVFQGASYFRAVGKNLHYGLSARGLALKTADMDGEEFPIFREFWIERPQPSDTTIVVHALLDSE